MKKFIIIFAAVALIAAFTIPAMAASEVTISGGHQVSTLVTKTDVAGAGNRDTSITTWNSSWSPPFSGLVFRFKVDDLVGGYANLKDNTGPAANGTGDWYGYYNMSFGQLKVGTYLLPPFFVGHSTPTFGGALKGIDASDGGFHLTGVKAGPLTLHFAVTQGRQSAIASLGTAYGTAEAKLPKLTGSATYNNGGLKIAFGAGYNSYEVYSSALNTATTKDLSGNIMILGVSYTMGAFNLQASVSKSNNPYIYGDTVSCRANYRSYFNANNAEVDAERTTWGASFKYTINPMYSVLIEYSEKEYEVLDQTTTFTNKDPSSHWAIDFPIKVHKNFTITPSYAVADAEDMTDGGVTTQENEVTTIGATWLITW